jgi:hypothetical protein
MNDEHTTPAWGTTLAWAHALLFLALAAACYLAPQAVFGDAAWQPLARLAVGLLAATLVALAVVLIGAARSGLPGTLRLALLAALVVDVQVPVLLSLHPAALEYLERDIGVPWYSASLACIALVAVTVLGVSSLRAQPRVDAG